MRFDTAFLATVATAAPFQGSRANDPLTSPYESVRNATLDTTTDSSSAFERFTYMAPDCLSTVPDQEYLVYVVDNVCKETYPQEWAATHGDSDDVVDAANGFTLIKESDVKELEEISHAVETGQVLLVGTDAYNKLRNTTQDRLVELYPMNLTEADFKDNVMEILGALSQELFKNGTDEATNDFDNDDME